VRTQGSADPLRSSMKHRGCRVGQRPICIQYSVSYLGQTPVPQRPKRRRSALAARGQAGTRSRVSGRSCTSKVAPDGSSCCGRTSAGPISAASALVWPVRRVSGDEGRVIVDEPNEKRAEPSERSSRSYTIDTCRSSSGSRPSARVAIAGEEEEGEIGAELHVIAFRLVLLLPRRIAVSWAAAGQASDQDGLRGTECIGRSATRHPRCFMLLRSGSYDSLTKRPQ
jgi:hypothetical protein